VKVVEQRLISRDEKIVLLITGNGLKDVAGAMKAVDLVQTTPFRVSPDLEAVQRVVDRWGAA
jgi:threonine synthase